MEKVRLVNSHETKASSTLIIDT